MAVVLCPSLDAGWAIVPAPVFALPRPSSLVPLKVDDDNIVPRDGRCQQIPTKLKVEQVARCMAKRRLRRVHFRIFARVYVISPHPASLIS